MRLNNKIALITGAAAGIGEATAELFVREGASVAVADLDGATAVKAMMDAEVARHGRLDILVNNAGYGVRGNVVTTEEGEWNALMAVNVNGVFLCSKHAIPHMMAQGGGVIVNIASTIALVGIPDRAAYVASKGAVAALTRAMALDHAADNIRVNSVAPGVVWSSYYDKIVATHDDPD